MSSHLSIAWNIGSNRQSLELEETTNLKVYRGRVSVINVMDGNLRVFGMWHSFVHSFVHLEGFFDIIDCLDFHETSKRMQISICLVQILMFNTA